MHKILSSKKVWLIATAALIIGALLIIQIQAVRSPAIAATAANTANAGTESSTESSEHSATEFTEGVHYLTIDPPIDATLIGQTADPEGITVTEFFWYGCPHCQYFEPLLEEWQKTFSDDLSLEQVPVVWNDMTQLHASIYYLGQEASDPVSLHHTLFEEVIALRKERDPNAQLGRLGDVLIDNGIESGAIKEKLNSPSIRQDVERANKLMRAAQVSSTPTMVVDYRWVILNDKETSEAGIFNVANYLIERARQDKK